MKYQNRLPDNKVQCLICPRKCILAPGQHGFCHVRKNVDGDIKLETYGYNTGLTIDPIEKKPLYHFYPGSKILSFGTLGCNMGCKFCQNWHISKSKENPTNLSYALPFDIAEAAVKHQCKSVAFTYNDPIIFYEYARDTAIECHKKGIKTVAVTAGYMNPDLHHDFFEHIDATNIDLKSFSDEFYKTITGAALEPVLETIKYVKHETDTWLELTTLLIEGENDSDEELRELCSWIKSNLGVHVPLHFSAFFPAWKMLDKQPTSKETLFRAYNIAIETGLKYVYIGNITNVASSTTYCEKCHSAIIIRNSYHIEEYNLNETGLCTFCGHQCHGVFKIKLISFLSNLFYNNSMNEAELLVKNITAKDENEAFAAASKMIDTKNVEAFKLLLDKSEMLFDFIKINVANRIKRASNKNNYKNLLAFFEDYSPDYDEVMVSILASNADEELTDTMYDLLENGSENQKAYAAKYFYFIPDTVSEDLLAKYAFSDNELLALNAAQALGTMNNQESYNNAINLLNYTDEFEKLKAVKFLVAYRNKAALENIYQTMENSAMSENIAAEIPYLANVFELLKSSQKEIALATVSHIISGIPEIIPLSQIINFQIFDILNELVNINSSQNPDSQVATILLKALAKFSMVAEADEYTFSEDRDTKTEINDVIGLLRHQSEAFWNTQKVLVKPELNQKTSRIISALEVVKEFKINDTVDDVLKLTEHSNDIIKCDAIATLAILNKLSLIKQNDILNKINDENLKALISSYFV